MMKVISFADVHFGANGIDPEDYFYNEFIPILERCYELTNVGLIVSCGEIFDKKLGYGDRAALFAHKAINALEELANHHKAGLIFCVGTPGHEGEQYNIHIDNGLNVCPVITYLKVGELIIRVIPDLTWNSYEEFRKAAFSRDADITVMHGLIEGAIPILKISEHSRRKEVIVLVSDLEANTRLFTVAGHVHKRLQLGKNTWYTGPLSFFSYKDANEKECGVDVISVKNDRTYTKTFIKNINSRLFSKEDVTDRFVRDTLDSLKAYFMLRKKGLNEKENIRFDVNDMELTVETRANFKIIKNSFSEFFDFNLVVESVDRNNASVALINNEGSYVLDTSIPITDKILYDIESDKSIPYHLKKKFNIDLIERLITSDVDTLLS